MYYKAHCYLICGLCSVLSLPSFSQIVGTSAYIKANSLEIGINGAGGFEGCDTIQAHPLPGMHKRSNTKYFGFVANPAQNNWATFDGDFFTPGTPENGWGIEIGTNGGVKASNNCSSNIFNTILNQIPGGITQYSHILDCYSVDWEGNLLTGTNLHFKINYFMQQNDLFYTTTVSITNNSGATIPDFYYYRNVDPDNNVSLSGYMNYYTTNKVISQPAVGGCSIGHVIATQSGLLNSYLGFAGAGPNVRVGYGGFSNRDASDMWSGTGFAQNVGSSYICDCAIYFSNRIQNFTNGSTQTFKYVVILSSADASNAINNLVYLSYPGSNLLPPSVCTPYLDTISLCGGNIIPVSVNGATVGNYTWSWSPSVGLNTQTGSSVSVGPASTTSYTVTGTPNNTCLQPVSFSFVATMKPVTPIHVSFSSLTVCPGSAVSLSASGANSYQWAPTAGLSCSSCASPVANPVTSTVYTVTGSAPNSCDSSVTISVLIHPDYSQINPQTICNGQIYSFNGNNYSGSGTYFDTLVSVSGCDSVIITQLSVSPTYAVNNPQTICQGESYVFNGNTYQVAGVYQDNFISAGGCDSIVITPLTVLPAFSFFNPQFICNGQVYNINGNNYTLPGTYFDTLQTISGCDSVIITHLTFYPIFVSNNSQLLCNGEHYLFNGHDYFIDGIYYDTLQSMMGCDSIIITQLTVHPVFLQSNQKTICDGESVFFNSHTYSVSGIYVDTLFTVFGCDSIILTNLNVIPLPLLTLTPPEDLCQDAPELNLDFVNPAGGIYTVDGTIENIFRPSEHFSGNHLISYVYNDPVTNCKSSVFENIVVHPLPDATFLINPKITTIDDPEIHFIDLSGISVSRIWDFGDQNGSEFVEGKHTYSKVGYYLVSMTITDNFGCKNRTSDSVFIGPVFTFYAPNAFTPNYDGMNDTFEVKGTGIINIVLLIFDRWGNRIYESNQLDNSWDGQDSPAGTYVYKIRLTDLNLNPHDYIGNVWLIR